MEICDEDLTKDSCAKYGKQLEGIADLTSFTFEGNAIKDEAAVCALFAGLSKYDKLENLNVRCNKFTVKIVESICKGISGKKELRVSLINDSE